VEGKSTTAANMTEDPKGEYKLQRKSRKWYEKKNSTFKKQAQKRSLDRACTVHKGVRERW
jgi:hypothetical protein